MPDPGAGGTPGGGPTPTAGNVDGPAPALLLPADAEPYGVTAEAHGEPERAPGGTVEVTMPGPGTVNGKGKPVGRPAAAAATAAVNVGPGPEPAAKPWPEPDPEPEPVPVVGFASVGKGVNVPVGCGCGVCAAFEEGVVGDEAARRVETAFCKETSKKKNKRSQMSYKSIVRALLLSTAYSALCLLYLSCGKT